MDFFSTRLIPGTSFGRTRVFVRAMRALPDLPSLARYAEMLLFPHNPSSPVFFSCTTSIYLSPREANALIPWDGQGVTRALLFCLGFWFSIFFFRGGNYMYNGSTHLLSEFSASWLLCMHAGGYTCFGLAGRFSACRRVILDCKMEVRCSSQEELG